MRSSTTTANDDSARAARAARAEDVLARTHEILPELHERAAQTALDRRLPEANVSALRRAGALKVVQSTRNGGYGLGMRTHVDVISTLGQACGSTAWVAGVVHAHSWLVSHFPATAQDEIYGANPDALVSAVIGTRGKAVRTATGYRLDGVWPFGSGCERSQWLLLAGQVVDASGEVIDDGQFAVPTSSVTLKDDWHVTGLAGTGSCTVAVDALDVPEHRFLSMISLAKGEAPGTSLHDDWVQRCPPVPLLTMALCCGSLGIARRALVDFPPLIKAKRMVTTGVVQDEHAVTHIRVGEAAILVDEAELLLYRAADDIDAAGRAGVTLDLVTRARLRMDCAQAVRRCLEAVEILFRESGGSGVRLTSPLCRALADLQAINNHGILKLEVNQELYGRVLLGHPPNTPLI